jgi:hypothetical protein
MQVSKILFIAENTHRAVILSNQTVIMSNYAVILRKYSGAHNQKEMTVSELWSS